MSPGIYPGSFWPKVASQPYILAEGGPLHPSLIIDSSGKEFPEKTDSDSDTEVFFISSGEGSGVTAKDPQSGKHTRSSSVSSLEGAFLSPLTTPESTLKETVKKKKGFF